MRNLRLLVLLGFASLVAVASAQVPFIYSNCLIFVEAKVNSKHDCLFLLDTGANRTAIDSGMLYDLGVEPHGKALVQGTTGTIQTELVMLDRVSVGVTTVPELEATTLDLSRYERPGGKCVRGILGYDFLKNFSIRVDFATKTLEFKRVRFAGDATMLPIPFRMDNGVPRVTATLEGWTDMDFRIDTGASLFDTKDVYVNITEKQWEKLRAGDPMLRPTTEFKGIGIGGEAKLPVAKIGKMSLGDYLISAPYVIIQPKIGYFGTNNAAGLISNNVLEKCGPIVVDYIARKLYITKKSS